MTPRENRAPPTGMMLSIPCFLGASDFEVFYFPSRKIIFNFQQKSEEGGLFFFGEVFVESIKKVF